MATNMKRREFLQATVAGGALCVGGSGVLAAAAGASGRRLVSPGCRRSKVRVGKIYMGRPKPHWPTPKLDVEAERQRYEAEFAKRKKEFADIDFVGNELVGSPQEVGKFKDQLKDVDGILVIHLTIGIGGTLPEILSIGRPTMVFAAPYSGHEWVGFGSLLKQEQGKLMDCVLTTDFDQLAVAVRPFRAIHHLREAKILNVRARPTSPEYVKTVREKLGTEIKTIGRQPVLDAYNAIDEQAAQAEAERWMKQAEKVVEPSKDEIVRSCRLALAFEKLLDAEDATLITVDCYGSMFRQLPAFPCIGHARLNNMGLGGMCESDLPSSLTQILFQGLVGKPGFVNDPTVDESRNAIILAHCMGTPKMDGPDGPASPYKIRTVMERQDGAVIQARMRVGVRATTARFIGTDQIVYFLGKIIEAPDVDRGCRTKITVQVDGSVEKLWKNWAHGLHRVTCYGDLAKDLERFCRFKGVKLINEAEQPSVAEA